MASNASFEHMVCNLQEREALIEQLYQMVLPLQTKLSSPSIKIFMGHITRNYEHFMKTIAELNLDLISFVSDYYSIMDEYTDQFHPQYLSLYTSHRNHYTNFKCSDGPFNAQDLIDIFVEHCYEFKHFKPHTEIGHLRRAREQSRFIYDKLSANIASKSIYELSDGLVRDILTLVEQTQSLVSDQVLLDTIVELSNRYDNTRLEIIPREEIFDYCECGNVMEIMASSSEMVCDGCGLTTKLIGTVTEDSQIYNQEGGRYKHAGYEPSKHCKCWLERIQAKETNTITQSQIDRLEACIRRDRISNKRRVTIGQLRGYLKDAGLTELNEHVALLKKIITGIVPPQLTFAETQDITNSFAKAVKAYNIVRPSYKSNNIYYPYILRKLIEMHVRDYNKQKELLSFIHLQGSQTLVQNDKIWRDICNITPSFEYQPTDRYAFMD